MEYNFYHSLWQCAILYFHCVLQILGIFNAGYYTFGGVDSGFEAGPPVIRQDRGGQGMEEMIVTTLENAIYMSYKNDVSFLVYDQLALYEHQSTWNPNMPLRNLFYVSNIYSKLTKDTNLYGSRLICIPAPQFVIFYNGIEPVPERTELKLSDAYWNTGKGERTDAALELRVQVLNINPGFNQKLLERCGILQDYMQFVCKVRTYAREQVLADAVEQAEAVLELLEDLEPVPGKLRSRIMAETNLALLRRWHKLSARASSLDQFTREMDQ